MSEGPREISYDEKRQQDIDDERFRAIDKAAEAAYDEQYDEIDLEFYRVPADLIGELNQSLNTLAGIEVKLTNYLVDSVLSGDNPLKEKT